jgi:hypothetical protein
MGLSSSQLHTFRRLQTQDRVPISQESVNRTKLGAQVKGLSPVMWLIFQPEIEMEVFFVVETVRSGESKVTHD